MKRPLGKGWPYATRGTMRCLAPTFLIVLVTTLGLPEAPTASAEERGPTAEQVTERTRSFAALWEILVARSAGLRIRLDEDLVSTGEFQGGRLTWFRSGLSIEAGAPLGESVSVGISPYFAWEHLSIKGDDDFVISQEDRDTRFTDFYDSGLRLGAQYRFDDTWGVEAVAGFSARHETGADYGDAAQAGGSLAVTYRRGSWLRLRLGAGAGSDISDGKLRFSPVFRIQIKPRPGWTIESSGLGGTIEWEATRRATLALGGHVDSTQYRLDQRGTPPTGSGDATLQRRQARLDLDFSYRAYKKLRLSTGLGLVLDEQLSLVDEDGIDTDSRRNRDPSVVFRFGIDLRI